MAPRGGGAHLRRLVDADDDPPHRARHPRDGCLPCPAEAVHPGAPSLPDAVVPHRGDNILQDSILSLGLAIAFYYAITGFACIWYFRRDLFTSARNVVYRFVFPLLGSLMLTYAFVQSAIDMWDVEEPLL